MKKLTYGSVKEIFESKNCKLISTEYINSAEKLHYIAQCGHENYISLGKFKIGNGIVCNKCSKSIRYDYEFVYNYYKEHNCTLLEIEYVNCKTPMRFIAECGHEHILTFDVFKNSVSTPHLCHKCQKINHYNLEYIKEYLEQFNCKLLSDKYDPKEYIEYIAQCGHKRKIKWLKFLIEGQGLLCKRCCKPKGEKHHNFNPNLTDEERLANRDLWENITWRNEVYKRDNYTCQRCGYAKGANLNAHHIEGYNINKDKRFDIENGITLCKECHDDFHKKNGYGNNTKEQFGNWYYTNTEVS